MLGSVKAVLMTAPLGMLLFAVPPVVVPLVLFTVLNRVFRLCLFLFALIRFGSRSSVFVGDTIMLVFPSFFVLLHFLLRCFVLIFIGACQFEVSFAIFFVFYFFLEAPCL